MVGFTVPLTFNLLYIVLWNCPKWKCKECFTVSMWLSFKYNLVMGIEKRERPKYLFKEMHNYLQTSEDDVVVSF